MVYRMKPIKTYDKDFICTAPYHIATECRDFKFGYCQKKEECDYKKPVSKEDMIL